MISGEVPEHGVLEHYWYSGLNAPEHHQNQDSDQDHHCQTPPQEHVIHLSLTPAAIPGLSVDQDRPEWFTEMCKMTETDIPQREDSLTYSRETQILLPASCPPIDPDNLCLNAPEHQENQDTDHHWQSLTQEHMIHENQSLTPAPILGLNADQDRPQQFTEIYEITDTDMEDAQWREHS